MTTPYNTSAPNTGTAPSSSSGLPVLAATPAAGVALVNGTPTILTYTAPNDGKVRDIMIFAEMNVTVTEVGGQVLCSITTPSGNVVTKGLFSAGNGVGQYSPADAFFPQLRQLASGGTVTIFQNNALTSGAAVINASIAGS